MNPGNGDANTFHLLLQSLGSTITVQEHGDEWNDANKCFLRNYKKSKPSRLREAACRSTGILSLKIGRFCAFLVLGTSKQPKFSNHFSFSCCSEFKGLRPRLLHSQVVFNPPWPQQGHKHDIFLLVFELPEGRMPSYLLLHSYLQFCQSAKVPNFLYRETYLFLVESFLSVTKMCVDNMDFNMYWQCTYIINTCVLWIQHYKHISTYRSNGRNVHWI